MYHTMCRSCKEAVFCLKNDYANNKRFTNGLNRLVRTRNTKPSLLRTAHASSGGTKNIGLRISKYGPSNLVSKSLFTNIFRSIFGEILLTNLSKFLDKTRILGEFCENSPRIHENFCDFC